MACGILFCRLPSTTRWFFTGQQKLEWTSVGSFTEMSIGDRNLDAFFRLCGRALCANLDFSSSPDDRPGTSDAAEMPAQLGKFL